MARPEFLDRSWLEDKTIKRIRYLVLSPAPLTKADPWEENKTKQHCPHCYTEHRNLWQVQLWIMQTSGGLEDSEPQIQPPTQWQCLHKAPSRKTWQGDVLTRKMCLDIREVWRRDSGMLWFFISQKNACQAVHPWPHLKPSKAQEILRSPKMEGSVWSGWKCTVLKGSKHANDYRTAYRAPWSKYKTPWE